MSRYLTNRWRVPCALALAFVLNAVPGAHAGEAYWHGFRGSDWSLGISNTGTISNWHAQAPPPPSGAPLPPPDGKAIFAPNAATTSVSISRPTMVGTMEFTSNAPQYSFLISGRGRRLEVSDIGVINRSNKTQTFVVADFGRLIFDNAAHILNVSQRSARISVLGGAVFFEKRSHGGEATVLNTSPAEHPGSVVFSQKSSAGSMTITNRGRAHLVFDDNSTADRATLINNADFLSDELPTIEFFTTGPAKDRKVSSGEIRNNAGRLHIYQNRLTVFGDFIQRAEGSLEIFADGDDVGSVIVTASANIAGRLRVQAGVFPPIVGRYVILRARGRLVGSFSNVQLRDFPNNLKGRIDYLGKDVVLFVEAK